MGTKTEHLDELATNIMWMREVLTERLRQMREKLAQTSGEEREQLEEYTPRLRAIVLGMGDLVDRIGIDVTTDDPEFGKQLRTYLGRRG